MIEFALLCVALAWIDVVVAARRFAGRPRRMGPLQREPDTVVALGTAAVLLLSAVPAWLAARAPAPASHAGKYAVPAAILATLAVVFFVAALMRRATPRLHAALAPVRTTIAFDALVLAAALAAWRPAGSLLRALFESGALALGFAVALSAATAAWTRLADATVPVVLRDFPIAVLTAGLTAVALLGLAGSAP